MYQNLSQFIEEKIQYYYDTYSSDITPSEEAFLRTALRQCAELTVEAIRKPEDIERGTRDSILTKRIKSWLNKE